MAEEALKRGVVTATQAVLEAKAPVRMEGGGPAA